MSEVARIFLHVIKYTSFFGSSQIYTRVFSVAVEITALLRITVVALKFNQPAVGWALAQQ